MIPFLAAGLLLASQVVAPRPVPRAGLSWAEADALEAKLAALEKRQKNGRMARSEAVEISESELNSYVNLKVKMPDGVTDVALHLEKDRLAATGFVDLDKVQAKPASSSFSPLSLLGGRVGVLIRGKVVTQDDAFASIEFEEVKLGSLPIPPSLLEQLVASATKSRETPEGLDILSPFRLPYSMKRVRLQPGRAFLDF